MSSRRLRASAFVLIGFAATVCLGGEGSGRASAPTSAASARTDLIGMQTSDARIKIDVEPITRALEVMDRLEPVSFRYRPEYLATHPELDTGIYFGVIAQRYAKVFPRWVKPGPEDDLFDSPLLQVDLHPAFMQSLAAIQDLHDLARTQQGLIENLEAKDKEHDKKIKDLEDELDRVKLRMTALEDKQDH